MHQGPEPEPWRPPKSPLHHLLCSVLRLVSLLDTTSSPYPRERPVLAHRDPRSQGCRARRTFLDNKSSGYLP